MCEHCKQRIGYIIDGQFYPVAYHIHKINGEKWAFAVDGRKWKID